LSLRIRAEHAWWLGLVAWAALVFLWRPEPPLSMLDAPSSSTRPPGYAILHDLLLRETSGVVRVIGRASQISKSVGVLLVLAPTGPVPETHRQEMMDWASSTGGTLIIGYPLLDKDGERVEEFHPDGIWPISSWAPLSETRDIALSYVPVDAAAPRAVPEFSHAFRGEMTLSDWGAESLLLGGNGEVLATTEPYGSGNVVQLAEADLLDNRALGWKTSHLFVAALIDEVGRDKVWAFDESHEGIEPQPSLVALLGSGRWRSVALQVLLLLIFFYWWRSVRLGRPLKAPPRVQVREVTTMAHDMGDFYFRAGESRWALSRTVEHLKLSIKERGAASEDRARAIALVTEAENELSQGRGGVERHAMLIRKMALSQRAMAESKGKR
jgi:hypothetical protein